MLRTLIKQNILITLHERSQHNGACAFQFLFLFLFSLKAGCHTASNSVTVRAGPDFRATMVYVQHMKNSLTLDDSSMPLKYVMTPSVRMCRSLTQGRATWQSRWDLARYSIPQCTNFSRAVLQKLFIRPEFRRCAILYYQENCA